MVMLTLGLLAYHVLNFIPIPYTALLLVRSLASTLRFSCLGAVTADMITESQRHTSCLRLNSTRPAEDCHRHLKHGSSR